MTTQQWYAQHGCTHGHCPRDCEHPQPFIDDENDELICGRCWFLEGRRTPMAPCTPEICQ